MLATLLAFLAGAVHETLCVIWVHYAERGEARHAGLVATVSGWVGAFGIATTFHEPVALIAFGLGSGVGTWAAVRWAKRNELRGQV